MNIVDLYNDFGIDYKTEGHKHTRPGWVNTECPFCTGNPGYHLGYNVAKDYFFCWRCGGHGKEHTLSRLLQLPYPKIKTILKEYQGLTPLPTPEEIEKLDFIIPETTPLTKMAIRYLQKRGFDVDELQEVWDIRSTSPSTRVSNTNYSNRIFIPIYWPDKGMVSYTTRKPKTNVDMKYISCHLKREVIPHKHLLYGVPSRWKRTGICVEGPTDVWKMGVFSFATFGIKFTPQQVRLIASLFDLVFVAYDSEPQAEAQAQKLIKELIVRGVQAVRVRVPDDPGALPLKEARRFARELINF